MTQGGGLPPIFFVHLKAKSNKEASTAAIYILHDVKDEFTKYTSGNMELVIAYVHIFKLILKKCNFHEEQEVA